MLTSTRQARDLLANPALQIYPGAGMTCVFDREKAKCRLLSGGDDTKRTPDLEDCRPGCANIARTDGNIAHIRWRAAELEAIVADPLSPEPRRERERHELARLQDILEQHDRTRQGDPS